MVCHKVTPNMMESIFIKTEFGVLVWPLFMGLEATEDLSL